MTATDTQPITTALTRLYADAQARGWQPDGGRHPRPGCWHDEDGTSEMTIPPAVEDVAMLVVSAHTPGRSLRLQVGAGDLDDAIAVLRITLGWPEEDAP